jgi:hypothetical protein
MSGTVKKMPTGAAGAGTAIKTTETIIPENLPDFNTIIADEFGGLGDYFRVTLVIDVCGGVMARYTIARERSVKAV